MVRVWCLRGAVRGVFFLVWVCCQDYEGDSNHYAQMTDPSREEEHVSLLGEEGLRAGGQQSLKLGYEVHHNK